MGWGLGVDGVVWCRSGCGGERDWVWSLIGDDWQWCIRVQKDWDGMVGVWFGDQMGEYVDWVGGCGYRHRGGCRVGVEVTVDGVDV